MSRASCIRGVLALVAAFTALACRGPRVSTAAAAAAGPPERWSVGAVTYELPLADAERLWLPAHPREPALSVGFDPEGALERAVKELASSSADVRVRGWRTLDVANERWDSILPVDADLARELALSVCPLWRDAWTPLALDVAVEWRDVRGELVARLPSSAQPVPPEHAVRVVCLPSRVLAESGATRARFTFVRVHRKS